MVFSKDQTRIKLPAWQEAEAIQKILNFVIENDLVIGDSGEVVGETTRNAGPGTINEHRMIWQQLRGFAILREDFQSATILSRDMCPVNPLPVKPETLAEFLLWKTQDRGNTLYEFQSTLEVRIRTDEGTAPFPCTGDWKSPGPIRKFRGAISYLHNMYKHL
jgi:hypothetical protein